MSVDGKDPEPGRGGLGDEDREAFRRRAAEIGRKLETVRERRPPVEDAARRGNALGQAFKIAVELVAGVVVGGAIGWFLDAQLGTRPWLFMVFLVLGFAAGMLNLVRTARRMQAQSEPLQRAARPAGGDGEGR